MINLIPFRKEIESATQGKSAWPYSSGKYILEVIDRAIAAESEVVLKENEIHKLVLRTANAENKLAECLNERDELKAKLSQFEREIPKTPEGFPDLDKDHLIKICIHQQSKLAEIVAQEPSIIVKRGKVVGFNHAEGTRTEGEFYAHPIPPQPIANNSQTVQASKPFGWFVDVEYCGFTRTKPTKYLDSAIALYEDRQVTPNKAEVPDLKEVANVLEWLVDFSVKDYEDDVRMINKAEEFIDQIRSLQPLKDE